MDFPFVKKKFSTPEAKNVIIMSDESTAKRLIHAAMPRNSIKTAVFMEFGHCFNAYPQAPFKKAPVECKGFPQMRETLALEQSQMALLSTHYNREKGGDIYDPAPAGAGREAL